MPAESTDFLVRQGEVRTPMDCHQCSKNFIALLDYSIDGNHSIHCPHCGHEHCRVIKGGKITADRWSSRPDTPFEVNRCRYVWKSDSLPATTSVAAMFIHDLWLNKQGG